MSEEDLKKTPLHALHVELGARMVGFAGYDMPVQYPAGIKTEHLHTRAAAGLFDVSHMGQVRIEGDDPAGQIETLVPADIGGLARGQMRYALFTADDGGILDDLMVTNGGDHLFVVVNAACKAQDIAHMKARLPGPVIPIEDRGLLALQGPQAVAVLARLSPGIERLTFMNAAAASIAGVDCFVSRSGYTGEDGFEISVPAARAEDLARRLLAEPEVAPIGLGARDSLRLEAGLCLYGHDIDTTTSPVEASLLWSVAKRRREEGGFPGAAAIQRQIREGVARKRVGIRPDGRAPAREHTEIVDMAGARLGEITSGGFGPSVDGPVAMGYVATASAAPGTELQVMVRGKPLAARVARMPFVTPNYHRG